MKRKEKISSLIENTTGSKKIFFVWTVVSGILLGKDQKNMTNKNHQESQIKKISQQQ
jgi:hypothetical protein